MPVRVLVVDDSSFFRRRISEILNEDPEIDVIGQATNGKEGVEQCMLLKPDVITMDIEMPVMNGISAVKEIMAARPTPVMMFSSLTHEGARSTLDALDAGAADFMPKKFEDIAGQAGDAKRLFCQKVKSLGRASRSFARTAHRPATVATSSHPTQKRPAVAARVEPAKVVKGNYKLVAIGASTGGPVALQKVIEALPASFPLPVLIIQHMPGTFTPIFSERMNNTCKVKVREARDGDMLQPGTVYVAPGGKQMLVKRNGSGGRIYVADGDPKLNYKPCIDITFRSLATTHNCRDILAIVLTGMGADGCEGARELKRDGATVWAQDEASCVVYGMPAAIVNAGLADQILSIDVIGAHIGKSI
jgi:two-component system chemotaxis response regulator CheB